MFLLFRRGSSYLDKSLPLSLRSLSENGRYNVTEKTCLLCKVLNNSNVPIRNQSSVTNPNANKTRKKKGKKAPKPYTDVLVVTKESSCFKKANITKLKPSDLNLLTTSDIKLNELYKLKNLSHTYSDLTSDETIAVPTTPPPGSSQDCDNSFKLGVSKPIFKPFVASDVAEEEVEAELTTDLEFKSLEVKDSLQPEVVEDITEPAEEPETSVEPLPPNVEKSVLLKRNIIAAQVLAAYGEVCNHLRNPSKGLGALHYHQSRSQRNCQPKLSGMKDLKVYAVLLKGFANKKDYMRLDKVLKIMKNEEVSSDLHCYAAILECLGRINISNYYLKEIRIFCKEAIGKGITFDDILNNAVFLNDEREQVLKAILAFDPNYVRTYKKPKVFYDNNLVNHLNHKEQLNLETKDSPLKKLIEPAVMDTLVDKQLMMEKKGYIKIKSIASKGPITKEMRHYREKLKEHYKMWADAAREAFDRDLATLTAKKHALNLEPYFRSVPSEDIVEIIVQEAIRIAQGSETYSPQLWLLYKMLGAKVYARYRVLRKQRTGVLDQTMAIHKQYCQMYANNYDELDVVPSKENYANPRIQWQLLSHERCKDGVTLNMGHQPWVPSTLTSIGKFLYHILMHDIKIDVNSLHMDSKHKNILPAFYTVFRSQGRIVNEEIKPHPILSKLYKLSKPETLTFATNEVPMVCPPVPWTSVENGGYIISPTDLARLPFQASSQRKRLEEADPVQLYPNFDALNQLSAVPWKVNTKILDVILEVFRKGGSAKLDVPEDPSTLPLPPPITPDMPKTEKYQVFRQKMQYRRKKGEMYSLWCDCLYRLSLAEHFRNDIFWLPHNMDFRGRVYPVPPHLNHLGSDLARSTLIFADPRPLGPSGLDWLKIHLINLTGLKKRDSLRDRLAYANEIMDLIIDSAENPLYGKKWWAESDEPWQTLACCMEIADVVNSGQDPALYMSHFPVHQDGSCNGLQHYAALGRDSAGAYSVNLAPSEVPQDVYSAVVALVEEQRAVDEAAGVEVARILNGFIKRKVIKQTIMTTVYGVTKFGARLQIAKQLKDIDDFPKQHVWAASLYLTSRTFESLRTMFTSTRQIQDWFTECARLITGVGGSLLEWVTPLGLPVVQPYIKQKKTSMPSGYDTFILDQFEKPNTMKQRNAFPPNFIHSLDSSHMMLTSMHCARAGITFVSVHDCYWTHPSTIHIMNKTCREQFVTLHSEPILENLSLFLYDMYSFDISNGNDDGNDLNIYNKRKLNRMLKQLPRTGNFDIKNVLDSIYFFS